MRPCESSTTPWVLPYWIVAGNPPQSWWTSYVCAPVPTIGSLAPALSSACKMAGANAAVCRNLRLEGIGLVLILEQSFRESILLNAAGRSTAGQEESDAGLENHQRE